MRDHGVRGPRRMRRSGYAGVVAERLREERRGVDPTRLLAVGVEAEDRPHRDAQREAPGPGVEVELRRRRSNRVERPSVSATIVSTERFELLAVERRQHDLARAPMEVAVDREQAVAEERRPAR